jgi:ABC-type glutathione transport system ATPase component
MLKVDINSVSVLFDDKKNSLLQNINFEIEPAKVYSILGKNGSGKSTLIKSITSLLPSNQYEIKGKALFGEIDLLSASEEELREVRKNSIRYVFQDAVNSLDPLKKVKYYFQLLNANVISIEKSLQFFLLPAYDNISDLYPYELSGGMAQRLLLVLALLANPDLLILDEPTSGVDYAVTNLILIKLKEFVQGRNKSVLMVTQDIHFAINSSDCISYLSEGTLSRFLTPAEFIKSKDDDGLKNFIQSFNEIGNGTT